MSDRHHSHCPARQLTASSQRHANLHVVWKHTGDSTDRQTLNICPPQHSPVLTPFTALINCSPFKCLVQYINYLRPHRLLPPLLLSLQRRAAVTSPIRSSNKPTELADIFGSHLSSLRTPKSRLQQLLPLLLLLSTTRWRNLSSAPLEKESEKEQG